jgi:SAM-dependent methyltransferase
MESVATEFVAARAHGRMIDLGCGNMPYRPIFAPHVSEYTGCDLAGNPLAHLHFDQQGRVPLADASAASVLSSQVLEHVTDPAAYLEECRRLLPGHGLLILSTHGVWHYHPDPTDYWRWTRDGLVKTITDHGFDVQRVHGVLGPEAVGLQHWQDAVIKRYRGPLRKLFILVTQWRIERADRRCSRDLRERDAGTYVAVATRTGEEVGA